jgi:hypothetical protein
MPSDLIHQISLVEERLRLAMLASDCVALDQMISPDLIFTNLLGQVCYWNKLQYASYPSMGA